MRNNKGQSALEFLLTYGWAILLVLILTVLLWQQGLFNLGGRVQPGSAGFWGVVPYEDFRYTKDGLLTLPLSNRVSGQVTIRNISATVDEKSHTDTTPSITMSPGDIKVWNSPSSAGYPHKPAKSNYNIFISISYNDSRTGETYVSSGWIWGNVEE
jgi:hypothetical protein